MIMINFMPVGIPEELFPEGIGPENIGSRRN
jgi:hypothetical protein